MGFFKSNNNQKEAELINGIRFAQQQIDQNNSMIDSLKRVIDMNEKRKKILQEQLDVIKKENNKFNLGKK